ncbi:lactotransferrin-like [Vigna unguiculata]|uniref:lactotransferrin-like n=1 Tax=Vigna unguiculata TaxID=3917 RepID=UPI001016BFFF|nr:lactotransferrin-like [Vigna unguiculata]XP_027935250.1 lactotransferrin-like [Vigna unguiculata]
MQIPTCPSFLLFFFFFNSLVHSSSSVQDFQPLPAPISGSDYDYEPHLSPPALPPVPAGGGGSDSLSGESVPPSLAVIGKRHHGSPEAPVKDNGGAWWCSVREEVEECRFFVSVINQLTGNSWKCVQREKAQECMVSIQKGEADLVNLEAGLAYTAFINHSMKAIASEMYCDHSKTYEAVAVVNRRVCESKEKISLMDFKGHKSCHGGYSTAVGWNYPINYIKNLINSAEQDSRKIAISFFSAVCAPSEVEGFDICSACSKENETCSERGKYSGHSGAFRCLVEELGDIAFVKSDTVLLYSMEGPHNQLWSTKSVRDFMYLCPQGGCREINGYPGDCSFGAVPADVIMTHNSMPNEKREHILETLTNTSLVDALHAPNNVRGHLFSPSTQGLAMIEKVTRLYLGKSASISQSIQKLNAPETGDNSYEADNGSEEASSSSYTCCSQVMTVLLLLMSLLLLGILTTK